MWEVQDTCFVDIHQHSNTYLLSLSLFAMSWPILLMYQDHPAGAHCQLHDL